MIYNAGPPARPPIPPTACPSPCPVRFRLWARCAAHRKAGASRTGPAEPTRRFRPTLAHARTFQFVRFIIAWTQYKPTRAPSVSRSGSSPFPLPPSQHFNLSPLCRHPSTYKYRCQSSIPNLLPSPAPRPPYTMPQGVLPPIRDILPGPSFSFLSLSPQIVDSPLQVSSAMNVSNVRPRRATPPSRSRTSHRPGQSRTGSPKIGR